MDSKLFLSRLVSLWPDEPSRQLVVTVTVVVTLAAFSVLRRWLYPIHPKTIPGPLQTVLPGLDADAIAALDYVPNAFPGARDVPTPYGSMRVYEWGPTTGRKVLFIHGISTSCQTLTKLAHGVVARGHRVILFDLFGRGFSDGVGDVPHDARLYVSQALCALASSPLSWLGDDGFDLVGYSLGGGVAVHFAAAFPRAVRSLVLLAPAGVIRPESFGVVSRFVFTAGLVPERLLAALTRARLQKPIASSAVKRKSPSASPEPESPEHICKEPAAVNGNGGAVHAGKGGRAKTNGKAAKKIGKAKANGGGNGVTSNGNGHSNGNGNAYGISLSSLTAHHHHNNPVELATSEVMPADPTITDPDHHDGTAESGHRLERRVMRYVRWMLTNHAGFVPAFMGCIREGPLMGQHETWRRLGLVRTKAQTTCVILAEHDEIIDAEHYEADALPLLGGRERVRWRVVRGSHDFVMTHSPEVMREIDAFWAAMPSVAAPVEE